jgi:hypothetical protein
MEEYYEGLGKFSSHTRFEVGDDSKLRFCHDLWYGDMALTKAFLDLYGIACAKDASVATHLELLGGSNQLNVSFTRAAPDWEVNILVLFFKVLHLVRGRHEGEDRLWWVPSKRCFFDVKSFYSAMVHNDDFHSLGRVFGQRPFLLGQWP